MNTASTVYLTKYPVHQALTVEHPLKPHQGWDLNSPVFRHRAIMHLFPQIDSENPRSEAAILFRLDTTAGTAPYFLIQSALEPRQVEGAETKLIELPSPEAGSTVAFRLAVNAIKRQQGGKRGERISSRTFTPVPFDDEAQETDRRLSMTGWLQQKLSPALEDLEILNHQRAVLGADRLGRRTANTPTIQVDTVDGFARINDTELLQQLLFHGVGRAKSYGCGLLSIRELER